MPLRPSHLSPTPSGEEILRPLPIALALAMLYLLLGGAHIVFSGEIAASTADSVESLQRLEIEKGLGFVLVTGLLFFSFAWIALRRVAKQERALLDQQHALVATERRATTALFAASVAHDINNVLTVANAHAVRLGAGSLSEDQRKRSSDAMTKALGDLTALSKRLLSIEREPNEGRIEAVDLARVVRESIEFARSHVRVRTCRIVSSLDEPLQAEVNVVVLRRMLLNLILNAADATNGVGHIELRLRREDGVARIEVHDDGPGVPDDQREKIFEVFYTSKPHGTGLGLLSVRVGAEEHGGQVAVLDSELGGACFRVTLPLALPRAGASPSP